MLLFFSKIDALRTTAFKFYQAIEREYGTEEIKGESFIIHTPMNIPAGTEGCSTKPYRSESFLLARAVFRLTQGKPNELADNIEEIFVLMEDYQSNINAPEESNNCGDVTSTILDKFNPTRVQLRSLCEELSLDMIRFKVSPGRFTHTKAIANLLEDFATKLVDEKLFGCTPALFELASEQQLQKGAQGLKAIDRLSFWFELKNAFEEMTASYHRGTRTEQRRISDLVSVLLNKLSKEETAALGALITKKHCALQAANASQTFNMAAEAKPKAITPALNIVIGVVPSVPSKTVSAPDERLEKKQKVTL
jgi:hypothetical protein